MTPDKNDIEFEVTERDGITEQEIMELAYLIIQQAEMLAGIAPGNPYRVEVADDIVQRAQTLACWVRDKD